MVNKLVRVLKPNWTLESYIVREFLFSFLVSFLFYFLVFFLNQLLLMAQSILAKGIPAGKVLRLMLYALPSFITLSAPFATLTASLMAYGRFSSDNEILAMRSAGFRRFQIFKPILILGILLAFLSFSVNNILLPAGTRAFQRLWVELSLTYPGLELEPFAVRNFKRATIVTGAIDEEGIHPMMIIERDNDGNKSSIMAALASPDIHVRESDFPGFRMTQVFSLTPSAQDMETWAWSQAESMEYRLLTGDSVVMDNSMSPTNMKVDAIREVIREKDEKFQGHLQEHEKSLSEAYTNLSLWYAALASGRHTGDRAVLKQIETHAATFTQLKESPPKDHSLQIWRLEYYQKYAIPFACIPFVVIAYTLGLTAKKSGRAVGFFLGLLLTTFYWVLLVLGRSLGLRTDASPFLVMVLPDIVLLMAGTGLYLRRSML